MKIWNYIIIMIGLMLGFYLMGIQVEGQQSVFNLTGIQSNNTATEDIGTFKQMVFSVSAFFNNIFGNTAAVVGILVGLSAAIIVGGLSGGRYSVENFIILPFISTVLVLFAQTMLGIINKAISSGQSWAAGLAMLLIAPFLVGFGLALIEFFRGTD